MDIGAEYTRTYLCCIFFSFWFMELYGLFLRCTRYLLFLFSRACRALNINTLFLIPLSSIMTWQPLFLSSSLIVRVYLDELYFPSSPLPVYCPFHIFLLLRYSVKMSFIRPCSLSSHFCTLCSTSLCLGTAARVHTSKQNEAILQYLFFYLSDRRLMNLFSSHLTHLFFTFFPPSPHLPFFSQILC